MVTVEQFRQAFNEFDDVNLTSSFIIQFHMDRAAELVNMERAGKNADFCLMLATAHFLTLSGRNKLTVSNGGTPGTPQGIVTSETVGPVSSSYSTSIYDNAAKSAGQWALTTYGLEFWSLMRMYSVGGMQLN